MKRNKHLFALIIALLTSGCGVFTEPKMRPVIEDKVGKWGEEKAGTLATTPERRIVLVNLESGQFCAEPSPDAAENIAANFSTTIAATTPQGIDAQLSAARAFAANSKQLFKRSQGVQLFRDGMYALCQAHLNKAIQPAEYVATMQQLLEITSTLVQTEFKEPLKIEGDIVGAAVAATLTQMAREKKAASDDEKNAEDSPDTDDKSPEADTKTPAPKK